MATFTIQTPLLVFPRVHSRTGTIERTCVFHNYRKGPLELRIGYDFPEHSWVQFYGSDEEDGPLVGEVLTIRPGENRIVLSINTDSFNFPTGRFRGRIAFDEVAGEAAGGTATGAAGGAAGGAAEGATNGSTRQSIELNFEAVEELGSFLGFAAIDLGTSSCAMSVFDIERDAVSAVPWSPRIGKRGETTPSAVFIRSYPKFVQGAPGGCSAGDLAMEEYRSGQPRAPHSLQVGTKRLIRNARVLVVDERGHGGLVDPLQILHFLGKLVIQKGQSEAGVRSVIRKVSVTFPPTWDYATTTRWRELFHGLGFADEDLDLSLDEASAAGLFYIYNCIREPDSLGKLVQDLLETREEIEIDGARGERFTFNLQCFDFGGGTIDIALIEGQLELLPHTLRLRLSLAGSDSCNYGGDQVTLAIFRMLKRRLALALCDPKRAHTEHSGEDQEIAAAVEPTVAAELGGFGLQTQQGFLLPDSSGQRWETGRVSWYDDGDTGEEVLRQNWGYVSAHITRPALESDIEDAIDATFPTRFLPSVDEVVRAQARKNFDWLWERAESLKIKLFDEVSHKVGHRSFQSFEVLDGFRRGISLEGVPHAKAQEALTWADEPVAREILSVTAGEVYRATSEPLEDALARCRRLAGSRRIDRVILSGQSCRMPIVSWMFSRPSSGGGLGVPPSKIEFDEHNAKTAVSKGACLLHVMRETLVGIEVDIDDFKSRLLDDLYYRELDGSPHVLFKAGTIDDFGVCEDVPETRAFPRYLSIFCGPERRLAGQFHFCDGGERLPPRPTIGARVTPDGDREELPTRAEMLARRRDDRDSYLHWSARLLKWTERERIAWMEETATAGSVERPIYRYYLTRNHRLYAVRDRGADDRALFALKTDFTTQFELPPDEDPFSGIH